jgi:hypothetical protein
MRSSHCLLGICSFVLFAGQPGLSQKSDPNQRSNWTDSFDINGCQFATTGENTYWILKPAYQLVLQGVEGKDTTRLVITGLNEVKKIGDIETRIVEEKESVNGGIVEMSRNYFAFCARTNTVFYFGWVD